MAIDELRLGGGSGGGDDGNNTIQKADGVYQIAANQVVLFTQDPDEPDLETPHANDHVITILAAGKLPTFDDGRVDIRGSQGVRITSGPPIGPPLPTTSQSTNGIEILTSSEAQSILLQQGTTPVSPKIELGLAGITVDGGHCQITIKSLVSISLSVAGGTSQILLTPAGIVIKGPLVQIN
jgi:hypothetical protein